MRTEIRNLQRRLARMILFVKAMSTADTIYLLSNGKVLQKGRPKEIYENPVCRRVPGPGQYIVDRFERTTAGDACCIRLGAPVLPVPAAIPDKGASVHTAGEMARCA